MWALGYCIQALRVNVTSPQNCLKVTQKLQELSVSIQTLNILRILMLSNFILFAEFCEDSIVQFASYEQLFRYHDTSSTVQGICILTLPLPAPGQILCTTNGLSYCKPNVHNYKFWSVTNSVRSYQIVYTKLFWVSHVTIAGRRIWDKITLFRLSWLQQSPSKI